MRTKWLFALVTSCSLALTSCGGGNGGGTGQLSVGITDAPVDNAEMAVIHVTSATLHGPTGDMTFDVMDPSTSTPGRDIDLLKYQAGQWSGLFDATVPAGHYSWIRLGIDLSQSYIQINGNQYSLKCTSCDKVGYKIVSSFNVDKDATLAMMLDFDLRKSIADPNGGSADYILRPTVRMIDHAASGAISGTIDPAFLNALGGGMCSVYVFAGQNVTPDDIYIPVGATDSSHINPVTTANLTGMGPYTYTAAFLPAGDYTIAVTCEADSDSVMNKDTLIFSTTQNVTVTAGVTTPANFPAILG